MYKEVGINTISSLLKFNRTVAENANIATLVKYLYLFVDINEEDPSHNTYVCTLLCNLPNLQHFSPQGSRCYAPLTDALLDSKLNSLISMGCDDMVPFSNDYITCALLLKDRLKILTLAGEGALFYRLYNKLHQFKKVEAVILRGVSTNIMEKLDTIVEKCTSIQFLDVTFDEAILQNDRPTTLLYTPRSTIDTLVINGRNMPHQSLLLYIMHKFQNLKNLEIHISDSIKVVDISTLRRFAIYAGKIKDLSICSISTDIESICDGVGSYWEALHAQNSGALVKLSIHQSLTTDANFSIWHNEVTSINFPFSNYNFRDMDLFVKYGGYVDSLYITGFTGESMIEGNPEESVRLLENLIASSVMFCGQLCKLTIKDGYINRTDRNIVFKTAYLHELNFTNCSFGDRAIDTVFGGVNQINVLKLRECQYRDQRNNEMPLTRINLPNTMIGSLSLENRTNTTYEPRPIFVLISRFAKEGPECVETSYMYDFEMDHDGCLKVSDNLEYSQSPHFYISCQSITSLKVNYNGHSLSLSN